MIYNVKYSIGWGWPVYLFSGAIFFLNLAFAYYFFIYLNPLVFLFFLPVLALDIILYPVYRSFVFRLVRKDNYDLLISRIGIEISSKMHPWESIKSISFQTGRVIHNYTFSEGVKLPALQMIYILDKDGNESSAVIDIDYFLKSGREKNNLIEAKKEIFDLGKTELISDWAEKR